MVIDRFLTVAAWIYIHWRSLLELAGLAVLVLAAALLHPILGLAAGGSALLLIATFSGR